MKYLQPRYRRLWRNWAWKFDFTSCSPLTTVTYFLNFFFHYICNQICKCWCCCPVVVVVLSVSTLLCASTPFYRPWKHTIFLLISRSSSWCPDEWRSLLSEPHSLVFMWSLRLQNHRHIWLDTKCDWVGSKLNSAQSLTDVRDLQFYGWDWVLLCLHILYPCCHQIFREK